MLIDNGFLLTVCACTTHVVLGKVTNSAATPSTSNSQYHPSALPQSSYDGRHVRRQPEKGSWWWVGRGALRRAAGGGSPGSTDGRLRRIGYVAVEGGLAGRIGSRVPGSAAERVGSVDRDRREVLAGKLTRYRGGAGGGYNYDDDYYGGGGEEDPYYDDGGGWGDDAGRGGGGGGGGRYDPYDDRRAPKRGRGSGGGGGFDLTGTITNGNKKYGVYALAGSILLTMMGVSLMFEKNLIRLGNLGFVAGMILFIGPSNVIRYFTQASKLRGTIIFMVGFFFVFTGHPVIGLAVEVFGFLNLFGNMLPMLWAMASNMPFVKDIIGSGAGQKKSGRRKQRRPSRREPSRYDDYGYDDDGWQNEGDGWGYDDYDRR